MPSSQETKERKLTRAQQEREEKLEDIARQVREGSLKIRKMTPSERERYGEPQNKKKPPKKDWH